MRQHYCMFDKNINNQQSQCLLKVCMYRFRVLLSLDTYPLFVTNDKSESHTVVFLAGDIGDVFTVNE